MIGIAESADFKECLKLLAQLGPTQRFTPHQLYLDNNDNGFTVLVKNNNLPIAISTFSIRKKKNNAFKMKALYWENLVVDKDHRDGFAYLEILGYLQKLIKSKKYEDIYFIVRRKKASATHKAARFKVIGYLGLTFSRIRLQFQQRPSHNVAIMPYKSFYKLLTNPSSDETFCLKSFRGFGEVTKQEISRQIYGKNGQVIIDKKNKQIQLVRTLFKSFLFQINLVFQDNDFDLSKKLECAEQSLISINLTLIKSFQKNQSFNISSPFIIYEVLSLKKLIDLNTLQFWEHDAW